MISTSSSSTASSTEAPGRFLLDVVEVAVEVEDSAFDTDVASVVVSFRAWSCAARCDKTWSSAWLAASQMWLDGCERRFGCVSTTSVVSFAIVWERHRVGSDLPAEWWVLLILSLLKTCQQGYEPYFWNCTSKSSPNRHKFTSQKLGLRPWPTAYENVEPGQKPTEAVLQARPG